MPVGEALDDDYVINLLKKDAEASKKSYAAAGYESLLWKPRGVNAPKPNTRFLRNIIRGTDSHNSALKAREEAESRARLRSLGREKRRRDVDDECVDGVSKRRKGHEKPGRWASVLGRVEKPSGMSRDQGAREERKRDSPARLHDDERRHRSDRRHDHDQTNHRPRRRDEDRSKSPRKPVDHRRRHSRNRIRTGSESRNQSPRKCTSVDDSDSDPLEDILGPRPANTSRGRGVPMKSAMDARFAPTYNPKTDVHLPTSSDDETSDWDMALEALRDRAKWRAQGGERLRAAGFGEEDVRKWEGSYPVGDGGGDLVERDVSDVKWKKRGEAREWDRGKVTDEEGTVELRPEWGRLKGT